MSDTLLANEIFLSLQGESTFAGLPCIFIRLTGCNLRCSYCDTAYAFSEGQHLSRAEVLARIADLARAYSAMGSRRLPLVELTGGEPLAQKSVLALMQVVCDAGFTVLVETNGALDISAVDSRVHRIMDLKCPSSGESHRNLWSNLQHLRHIDEVKFVIGSRQDYDWAKEILSEHKLATICPVLFSWAAPPPTAGLDKLKRVPEGHTPISRQQLAELILADALPVRFQLQMHKFIWPPDRRGV